MSTSFLQQGKWNSPALVLGFDPREVVRQAVLSGTLPAPRPSDPKPAQRPVGRPTKYHTTAERKAALKAAQDRAYARRRGEHAPLLYARRPELAGLKGRAYHRRYLRLWKAGLLKPAASC